MPEANVLYSVTAVVVFGLVAWVSVVLKTAKEPWARELPKAAPVDDVPLETSAASNEMTSEGAPIVETTPPTVAEETAEATKAVVEKMAEADAKAKADADAKVNAEVSDEANAKKAD